MTPRKLNDGREFVWRSTCVKWEQRGAFVSQLVRTTFDEFETIHQLRQVNGEVLDTPVRLRRRALPPEDVAEFWACRDCHRVARTPRDNSFSPGEPIIKHYLACERAPWQRDFRASRAFGFDVEVCDGVEARNWRCATCRIRYSEKEVDSFIAAERKPWHRRGCVRRVTRLATKAKTQALLMRNREALGQESLFSSDDLEVTDV